MQIREFPSSDPASDDWLLIQKQIDNTYGKVAVSAIKSTATSSPWVQISQNAQLQIGSQSIIAADNLSLSLPASPSVGDLIRLVAISSQPASISLNLQGQPFKGAVFPVVKMKQAQVAASLLWVGLPLGWIDLADTISAPRQYKDVILNSNPLFFLRLGESSGTRATDSSINAIHGTYLNATLQAEGKAFDGDKAVRFNGNGMVYFANSLAARTVFSLECWFRTTALNGSLFGFSSAQQAGGGNFDRELYLLNGALKYYAYQGADLTTLDKYNDDQWHCVSLVANGANGVALWVDGVLRASSTNGSAQGYTGYWHVGYSVRGGYFTGIIDEASINNSAVINIKERHEAY